MNLSSVMKCEKSTLSHARVILVCSLFRFHLPSVLIRASMLFSGKIPSHVAARLTAKYWYPICYDSPLSATVHYSYCWRVFALSVLFAIRYSGRFAFRDYLLFGFCRHPRYLSMIELIFNCVSKSVPPRVNNLGVLPRICR